MRAWSRKCPLFFAGGAPGSLKHDFEQAGLGGIEEHRQPEVLEFANERALLSEMLLGAVALAVKRFTPEVMAEAESEFLDSVKDHRTADGSYRIPGEFVTVVGYQ